jgi:hypothetical protein
LQAVLGPVDLEDLAARCRTVRSRLGKPTGRWTAAVLGDVLAQAVLDHGWPAQAAVQALLAVAGDRATRSPARLSCPGPWWDVFDRCGKQGASAEVGELAALEGRLLEADGRRVWAQRLARDRLTAQGRPVTRLDVSRLACQFLDEPTTSDPAVDQDQDRDGAAGGAAGGCAIGDCTTVAG